MPDVVDRTTIETDWKCGRKRWWFAHHGGRGIVPIATPAALRDGIAIHAALAAVLEGGELALPPFPEDQSQEIQESWARQVGWLVAFFTFVWPRWFGKDEVVAIEKEMVLDRGELWVPFTADLILRSVTTQKLFIIDFKSVGMLTKEWAESWPFAIQLHLNLLGAEEELGEAPSHALIIGLQKGQQREGKLRHPYVWAYSDGENWSTDWKKGWALRPVWEFGAGGAEGVREWVLSLGEETALAQFPVSQPIVLDREMAEGLIVTQKRRETVVNANLGNEGTPAWEDAFPQRFSQCRAVIGGGCDYVHACHNRDVGADPIGSGLYKVRIPHHDVEVD